MRSDDKKFHRVGIRLKKSQRHGFIIGHQAEVYDVDSGKLFPAIQADIHLRHDEIVTATVTLEVAEVEFLEDTGNEV